MGMGIVFAVLTLLWALISLLAWTDRRSENTGIPLTTADQSAADAALREAGDEVPADLAAAIMVAVLAHRSERRREAGPEVRSHAPGSLPSRWVGIGRTRQTQGWDPGRRQSCDGTRS